MTLGTFMTHLGQNVRSDLDTDQDEGIRDQLKFAAQQLSDHVHFYLSHMLKDEYSDLPNPVSIIKC